MDLADTCIINCIGLTRNVVQLYMSVIPLVVYLTFLFKLLEYIEL
jgi:hypothetical protein